MPCVTIWLMGQCSIFLRSRELFAQEPFSITIDGPFVDELTELSRALLSEACRRPWRQRGRLVTSDRRGPTTSV